MPFRLSADARLVRFPAADGTELEGRLTVAGSDRGVVLCHPHPRYGGSMLTPVILTAEQAFREAGYTTLAFNFRGVGGSHGTHGGGQIEAADVIGALDFLSDARPDGVAIRAVVGYSFGSVVGGRVAAGSRAVAWYLGIALPLDREDFSFLRTATCRIALVGGTRDQFGHEAKLRSLAASLPATSWLRVLDAEHFFVGALEELAVACRDAIAWAGAPAS